MYRNAWLVLAATLVVTGCSCGDDPISTEHSVRILAPLDGATLRAADDVAPNLAGLQIDVQFVANGFSKVTSATLQLDGADTGLPMQERGDGTWFFAGLTVGSGPHVLTVDAKGLGADGKAEIDDVGISQVTVELAVGDPNLTIASPAPGTLNRTADLDQEAEGVQVEVEVVLAAARSGLLTLCSTTAAPADAASCAAAPGRVVATAALEGEATKRIAISLPEGAVDLAAELRDDVAEVQHSSPTVQWTVDSVPPTIAFVAPSPAALLANTPVPVLVQTDAEPGQVVTITGGVLPVSEEVGAGGEVLLEVPAAQGPVTFAANVSDRAGNPAIPAEVSFTLDSIPCELTLVSPATPTVHYNGGQDLDPATPGLQVALVAMTSDCKDRLASLYVNGDLQVRVPADASTGEFLFSPITFQDGATDVPVSIELLDAAGNLAKLELSVSVRLHGPDLVLVTSTVTRNLLTDADYTTPGIQVNVTAEASAVQGGTIQICSTIANAPGAAPCRVGGFAVTDAIPHASLQTPFIAVTLADGSQEIFAEVVDAAGNESASPRVALVVDSIAPKVTSIVIAQDSAGGAPDGLLSATELPPGQQATFTLAVSDADGQTLSLFDNDGAGPVLASGTVTGGQVTLQAPLAEGTHTLLARVARATGNPNISSSPLILNPEARLVVTVDRTPPVLSLVGPATSLNKSHDVIDPATEALEILIEVATDISSGRTVQFLLDGIPPLDVPVVNGRANFQASMLSGQHTIEVVAIDRAGNETRRSYTFNVDTLAPTLAFSSPGANQTLEEYTVPVVLDTDAEAGQVVTVTSSAAAGQSWTATVDAAGKATLELTLANGVHTLTANVKDRAGNPSTPATVTVTITATGCQIGMVAPTSNPARFGASADKDGNAGNGLQVDIAASTVNCAGRDAVLVVAGAPVDTVAAGAGGEILFSNVTFADGANNVPVAIRMTDLNGETTEIALNVSVKLTAPTLTLSPARPASGTVTYVAETNPNVDGVGVIRDLVPGGDAEAELGVVVGNAQGGTVTVKLNGFDLVAPLTIDDAVENFGGPLDLIYSQGTDASLVVTAEDPFGNVVSETYRVLVDVQAPAAPVVIASLADNRAAKVDLEWTSTGDDDAAGALAGYDIRYLTSTAAGLSLTCPTLDDAAFGGTSAVKVTSPPAGGAPNEAISFALEGLPPLNCYSIAVRARDEVGNLSPLTNVVTVENHWNLSGPYEGAVAGSLYGMVMRTGDFDNDGATDLVVSARAEAPGGKVYVHFGQKNGQPSHATQVLAGTANGELFGIVTATGDLNGDGIDDLVVGASAHASSTGRAFIYFGLPGQQLDPSPIEIRGRAAGGRFGYSMGIIDDIDGDGLNELLVAARTDGPAGHVFLFKGRTKTEWQTSRTSNDGNIEFISAANATRFFAGEANGNQFGARDGFVALGDLDQDGRGEFAIPASLDSVNKLYLYNGATVNGISGRTVETSDASLVLGRTSAVQVNQLEGFGAYALGGNDFNGDGFPDLVVSQPLINQVLYYAGDPVNRTFAATPSVITFPGVQSGVFLGASTAAADLNNDGKPDLVIGNNAGPNNLVGSSTVWIHFNDGGATPVANLGAMLKAGVGYSQVATGDFNGDGKLDLAIADSKDAKGKVWIYAP